MYLFKCKCGCVFTIKNNIPKSSTYVKCQNCDTGIRIYDSMEFGEFKHELDSIGMTMQIIPDDSKITVSFEA